MQFLERPGGWERLFEWLTVRATFLPLLGTNRQFVRQIERMEPEERQAYSRDFLGNLLKPDERAEWEHLVETHESVIREMVTFWRRHGQL